MERCRYTGGVFGVILIMTASNSNAAVITKNYDISASDFIDGYGNKGPYESVNLNFTVTFDESSSFSATTSGLDVNKNTLPFSSKFEYNAVDDTLIIATEPVFSHGSYGYLNKPNGFGSIILNATSASPALYGLGYDLPNGTAGGYVWVSREFSLTTSALNSGGSLPSPVPLPASAPLFGAALLTLGAVGSAMKRKGLATA